MDPLSVTLTVIAIATAVKDLIEVAQNVKDAFSKLPSNYKKAKDIMEDIQDILHHMGAATGENFQNLEHAEALKESLYELKEDLMYVESQCAVLLPPKEVTTRKKFKIAVYTFWNREKLEELIEGLKKRVDKSLHLFKLLSQVRTEMTVAKIHDTLQASDPTSFDPGALSVTNDRLFSFTQSDSLRMTWMRETIPAPDLSKAFLRREFDILVHSVESLATRWFNRNVANVEIVPVKSSFFLHGLPASESAIQRDALVLVYNIRDVVESPDPTWVHRVDNILSFLVIHFSHLGMHAESMSVRVLRVKLWEAVNKVHPNQNALLQLVTVLTGLAVGHSNMGDVQRSHEVAQHILRMVEESPDIGNPETLHSIYARTMAAESNNYSATPATSLQLAESSAQHMASALTIVGCAQKPLAYVADSDLSNAVDDLVAVNTSTHDYIFEYAYRLTALAVAQLKNGRHEESHINAKRALIILHRLLHIYPNSTKILHALSSTLSHLLHPTLTASMAKEEVLKYAEEQESIHAQLAEVDPQRYVVPLFISLYSKRDALLAMGKNRQAQAIHQRMLGLGRMAADSYPDLKIPSEIEGDYYLKTAEYHFNYSRFQDAIYAAQNAVAQYSALEEMIPGQSPVKRFKASAFLCQCQAFLKQWDSCLEGGFKALRLIDSSPLVKWDDPLIMDSHMELLDKMMEALDSSADTRCLEWAREIDGRIQKLFTSAQMSGHKLVIASAQAPSKYVSILQKNELVEEAALYLEAAIARWDDTYGKVLNVDMITVSYLQCLMALPDTFKDKGQIDKALHYSQQAMDVTENFFKKGFVQLKAAIYNNLSSTHIYLLCDAGRYDEALQLSELAVAYIRENERIVHGGNNMLVQALGGRVFCLLYSCRPEEAIAVATESVELSRKALEVPPITISRASQFTLLYISLLNLADGHADAGDPDKALLHLGEAREALIQNEIANEDDVGTDVHSYRVLDEKEARVLFAKGDYARAAELVKRVLETGRERAKSRKNVVSSLILALQFAGILYCTMGRHEDGVLVASEVAELKASLEDTPALKRLVQVEEKRMVSRGKWRPIQIAKDRLTCGHQHSIIYPESYDTVKLMPAVSDNAAPLASVLSRFSSLLRRRQDFYLYSLVLLFICIFISFAIRG